MRGRKNGAVITDSIDAIQKMTDEAAKVDEAG